MKNTEIIALVGPFSEEQRSEFEKRCPEGFSMLEIKTEDDFHLLGQVDYVVLRTYSMQKQEIELCPRLKLIQRWGVGYDTVDVEAAGQAGIPVMITQGINAVPVAEFTVGLILAVYRNLIVQHKNVESGRWRQEELFKRSYIIRGKKVGLVGLGSIGSIVAKILQGMGATIFYYDQFRIGLTREKDLDITYVGLQELFETSDIISLHVPLTNATLGLINADLINRMKPNSVIINTARGEIIDENALYFALSNGKILGAGLDVFTDEPVVTNNPLVALENVVLSAHCAGNTVDNNLNMVNRCIENILRVRSGNLDTPDLVNKKYLKSNRSA